MYSNLLYLIIFFTGLTHSQNVVLNDTIKDYDKAYEKLKHLYLRRQNSDSFKKSSEAFTNFKEKLNYDPSYSEALVVATSSPEDNALFTWIRENIKQTDYKDFDEAMAAYNVYAELSRKSIQENKEYIDFLRKALMIHGPKIFSNLIEDILINHPEITHY